MNFAILFPGQGSQSVGMGKDLYDNFSVAKDVFSEVDDSISQNLSQIIFEGDENSLNLTANTQPAIMTVSVALARVIEKELNKKIYEMSKHFAGHSLGEFSALCASGSFSLSDTAKLLKLRGEAMQRAVPIGKGGMVALVGAKIEDVQKLVLECSAAGVCEIANDNGAGQFVISGEVEAMNLAVEKSKDFSIKRAIPLKVSAPFHSSLIKSAAVELNDKFDEIQVLDPNNNCYANINAKPYESGDAVRSGLVEQVTSSVKWRDTMNELHSVNSINNFVEIGPGKVLSNLVKKELGEVSIQSINNVESLKEFLNKNNQG